jgi:hypothetical protein
MIFVLLGAEGLAKDTEYCAWNTLWPFVMLLSPQFDEICHHFVKFARACLFHDTIIIRSVALYTVFYMLEDFPF